MAGVALLADMGTGKTAITLAVIQELQAQQTLVLCPKAVLEAHTWATQAAQHLVAPLTVLELVSRPRARTWGERLRWAEVQLERLPRPVVVVLNYDALDQEAVVAWLQGRAWDLLVLDESHRIKAPTGRRARVCWRLATRIPRRIIQTGTLMPHSPLDVWSQFRVMDAGVFGTSLTAFRARYAVMGGYLQREVVAWRNEQELHDKIDQYSYRVGAEVLELPPERHVVVPVQLGAEARRVAAELEEDFYAWVAEGHEVTVANALVKLLRLQQVTSGFVTTDDRTVVRVDTAKEAALQELLEEIAPPRRMAGQRVPGEPLVVFCRFRHDLDVVAAVAERTGREYGEVSGRRNDLAAWQAGAADVLGVQIQAGGVGIDLTRTRYAVYYSVGYSLGDYMQSVKRVHRPGQTRAVTYYHLVAQRSIDEEVYRSLQEHADVVARILDRARARAPRVAVG
jgi:SNF2 family DNA or RNA helicase